MHQCRAIGDTLDGVVDQALDLLGRVGRALRQRAHFRGDHGEAAALFAGARGFHRGVQCQDVGLEGDAVDHRDDLGDLLRRGFDVAHGGHHLADHVATLRGDTGRALCQLVGLAGVFGVLLHGGGQFLHRGGGLFQVGGLLLGAARQVAVALRNLAGGQVDAAAGGLDTADDFGQLGHGGVGVIAHLGEHAVEVAFHAVGQVAIGDRAQQRRQRSQVAVGGGHQAVERFHHRAEIVLERGGIAAHGEVASGGGGAQALDFLVDRAKVALDRVHGLADDRLFARQARHVLAQVADRVALGQVDDLHLHFDVLGHQLVGVVDHAAVIAREAAFVHAEADLAGFMATRHFLLCLHHRLQLLLHVAHALQQLAGLIAALHDDRIVEVAAGNRTGDAGGFAQRSRDRTRNGIAQADGQQRDQAKHGEHHRHRALVRGVGLGHRLVQVVDVVGAEFLQRREQIAACIARLGGGDGAGAIEIAGVDGFGDLLVRAEVGIACLLDLAVDRHFVRIGVAGDVVVALFFLGDGRLGVGHALVVVGDLGRVVLAIELRDLVRAVLAKLRTHFAEVLYRRHPVFAQLDQLVVARAQPQQRERAQGQGHQGRYGEGERQLSGDRQILEPLHVDISSARRAAVDWEVPRQRMDFALAQQIAAVSLHPLGRMCVTILRALIINANS